MLQLPIKTFSSNHAAGIAKAEQELFAIHGTRSTLAVPMLIALNTFNRNVDTQAPWKCFGLSFNKRSIFKFFSIGRSRHSSIKKLKP